MAVVTVAAAVAALAVAAAVIRDKVDHCQLPQYPY